MFAGRGKSSDMCAWEDAFGQRWSACHAGVTLDRPSERSEQRAFGFFFRISATIRYRPSSPANLVKTTVSGLCKVTDPRKDVGTGVGRGGRCDDAPE